MTTASREHEHGFDLFGTHVRLLIGAPAADPLGAKLAGLRVQRMMNDLHERLTRFAADSELSRLNSLAGRPVHVSITLLRAVQAAICAASMSDGLVDPTLTAHLERAGYTRSRAGQPSPTCTQPWPARRHAARRHVRLTARGSTSRSTRRGARSGCPTGSAWTLAAARRALPSTSPQRCLPTGRPSRSTPAATSAWAASPRRRARSTSPIR